MTQAAGAQPTLIRRLLLPRGQYRTGALRTMLRMRWFIRIRWVAIAAGVGAGGILGVVDPVAHRPAYVMGVIAVLIGLNLIWQSWSRRIDEKVRSADAEGEEQLTRSVLFLVNAQMAADLTLLTVLIRVLGGVLSPLVMFYVFHVAIAAVLLAPMNALLQALWALLLYSVVVFGGCAGWIGDPMPLVIPSVEPLLARGLDFASLMYAGVAVGLLGIWYFVSRIATQLDRREEELRKASEALLVSHQAIDELQVRRARFMRTAAHQLKSPLAGIQTLAGLVADGVVTGDAVQATTGKIVRRCKEAIGQVNELLTLARLKEEGVGRHASAATDLVTTLNELMENYRGAAQGRGIELVLHKADGFAPRVRVDPRDLKDCLGNLMDNAIKYSGNGKHVEVRAEDADGGVAVSVRDEGIGMDEATLQFVFDEFRRGNQALALQIPGSGLGLSIVREILEHAGGRITVSSTPGKGSTFLVWLPLAETRISVCPRPAGSTVRADADVPRGVARSSGVAAGDGAGPCAGSPGIDHGPATILTEGSGTVPPTPIAPGTPTPQAPGTSAHANPIVSNPVGKTWPC